MNAAGVASHSVCIDEMLFRDRLTGAYLSCCSVARRGCHTRQGCDGSHGRCRETPVVVRADGIPPRRGVEKQVSVAARAGRAMARRNSEDSECRGSISGRRQHRPPAQLNGGRVIAPAQGPERGRGDSEALATPAGAPSPEDAPRSADLQRCEFFRCVSTSRGLAPTSRANRGWVDRAAGARDGPCPRIAIRSASATSVFHSRAQTTRIPRRRLCGISRSPSAK